MSGLLIDGEIVPVPGVRVIGPHEAQWAHLDPGDCRPRRDRDGHPVQPHQIILHRTQGDLPDRVMPGAGPPGGARRTAEFWQQDPAHSGAQIVAGEDGEVACLTDLIETQAYHATVSNLWSIGIEMHENGPGKLYEVQLDAVVAVVLTICRTLGIQLQVPREYKSRPIQRMMSGGRDCYGVFGHRDNTGRRGRWDPGDAIFARLVDEGAMEFDFDAREDLAFWMTVQSELASRKLYHGAIDGLPGPATCAALKADGYIDGVYALGKVRLPPDA